MSPKQETHYVVLQGDKLQLYGNKVELLSDALEQLPPAHSFVVCRREGFLTTNDGERSFTLMLQDSKVRSKIK
jgi:hypothetical protein